MGFGASPFLYALAGEAVSIGMKLELSKTGPTGSTGLASVSAGADIMWYEKMCVQQDVADETKMLCGKRKKGQTGDRIRDFPNSFGRSNHWLPSRFVEESSTPKLVAIELCMLDSL